MPRKTHKRPPPEEATESINVAIHVSLTPDMKAFLDVEAKREGLRLNRTVRPSEIVRALITAYYEKRMAGMLVGVDD